MIVVKAGGDLATRGDWLAGVASDVAGLRAGGAKVVFVHGGGPQLDAALEASGLPITRVAGRRATTPEVLARAVEIWRGTLSVQWVRAFQAAGAPSIGLSGVDGAILGANRRPPTQIDGQLVDFGEVGDLHTVRTGPLVALLEAGLVPVISPLAVSDAGQVLNVNADTVAAHVAIALGATRLVLLTRSPGILRDPADPTTTLRTTTLDELASLERTGAIHSGMRPKIAAIRTALEGGVSEARVVDGRSGGPSAPALLVREGGTTVGLRIP
ncbi:MAG: acetylglutamate kinase [Alphaproteobacteria bacterium]|nr:acetylglutamate kinase [Alphaproteobacteria bacterium]